MKLTLMVTMALAMTFAFECGFNNRYEGNRWFPFESYVGLLLKIGQIHPTGTKVS